MAITELQRKLGWLIGIRAVIATALLSGNPSPSEEEIRIGLSGNLCRCTGYVKILAAVQRAAATT